MHIGKLIHQYIHLDVLIRALQHDQQQLKHTKMSAVYHRWFQHLLDQITNDFSSIRVSLRTQQVQIIQIIQHEKVRTAEYKERGYIRQADYPNGLIKVVCEELLERYIKEIR